MLQAALLARRTSWFAFSNRLASYGRIRNPQSAIRDSQSAIILRAFENAHGFDVVKFFQHHLYYLGLLRRNNLSHKIRLDRQFPMLPTAVNQDRKLNLTRATEIHQLVECSADRAARVEDVIDKNNYLVFDVIVELGSIDDRVRTYGREVVAIEGDIDDPVLRALPFERFDLVDDPFGERHTSTTDPDYIKIFCTLIVFNDLGCESRQGTLHTRAVHYAGLFSQVNFVSHSSANRNKRGGEVQKNETLSFKTGTASFNIDLLMMTDLYQTFIRRAIFMLDAETAHELGIESLRLGLGGLFVGAGAVDDPVLRIERFGLSFDNPLGVAAGFDKNAVVFDQLEALGFGFVEVGTVTLRPQKGNERPRLFRLPEDEALINRLGFNNDGAETIAGRLRGRRKSVIGVNIGRNKDVPNDEAVENYLAAFDLVHPVADYIAVNISSPNTPGLRELQKGESFEELISALMERNRNLSTVQDAGLTRPGGSTSSWSGEKPPQSNMWPTPILVKIAPDLTEAEIEGIVDVCVRLGVAGIIATNTTISREGLRTPNAGDIGPGGLSGKPLSQRSNEVIRIVYRRSEGKLPIIGVGGIFTAEDAFGKIAAGASLLQAYTGFVYKGPSFALDVNRGLAKILKSKGFSSLDDAVGSGV
jgi:dihydroorotate dehydrogenase